MDYDAVDTTADTSLQLLIVDDDARFCATLQRAFEQRGYVVRSAQSCARAREILKDWVPELAVVDLRLGDGGGLGLVSAIRTASPGTRVVVLTGYASIATAVEAIKLGATNYLTKPVSAPDIEHAFGLAGYDAQVAPSDKPLSVDRMEWEYIHRVLAEKGGNISATARALNMHRRTLQRKLNKFPVRE